MKGVADKSQQSKKTNNNISIQADDSLNAIIITAPQITQSNIQAIIRQLDIRRAQVLIEAIIAEVSSDYADQIGVQWASNTRGQAAAIGGVNFDGVIPNFAINKKTALASAPKGLSLLVGQVNNESKLQGWGALVNLMQSNSSVNLLSAPSIVTVDNTEASILVGQEVPFISNTQLSASNTNPFQNFVRKNVGLSLKVKPQINEGDAIKLDIEQEVSNILANARAPDTVTSKRTLKTSVLVDDGKVIVLGGLMDESQSGQEFRVPFLGDIPLLGYFFRYGSTKSNKRNLMIFIKPEIIRDSESLNAISLGKYNNIRLNQQELRTSGKISMSIYESFISDNKDGVDLDTNPAQFID